VSRSIDRADPAASKPAGRGAFVLRSMVSPGPVAAVMEDGSDHPLDRRRPIASRLFQETEP